MDIEKLWKEFLVNGSGVFKECIAFQFEKNDFIQKFVEAGKQIIDYECNLTPEKEMREQFFGEKPMRELGNKVYSIPDFSWKSCVEKELDIMLQEIDKYSRSQYKRQFMEIIQNSIEFDFPQKQSAYLLKSTNDKIGELAESVQQLIELNKRKEEIQSFRLDNFADIQNRYDFGVMDFLDVSGVMIKSSTKIAIYFNTEVPKSIEAENICIIDESGRKRLIQNVTRHCADINSYWMDFSDGLIDGKYIVDLTVGEKEFKASFIYDVSVWPLIDAVKRIVHLEFEKVHRVSASGMNDYKLCLEKFKEDVFKRIDENVVASQVKEVRIELRPFKYEIIHPNVALQEGHVMVSIWVGIFHGDANCMENEFVEFECVD